MKTIIILDSDSEEVVEVNPQKHQSGSVLANNHEQKYPEKELIAIFHEDSKDKWLIDARLKIFSQLLQCLEEEPHELGAQVILTLQLPSSIRVNSKLFELVENFYQRHAFKYQGIVINKITIEGYKKSLDAISLQYLEESLRPLGEEQAKYLFRLCQYMKFNHLKQLVSVYIASQNFYEFNDRHIKAKINEMGAYYSRDEEITIHEKLRPYVQQLGLDILQKLREKYEKRHNQGK